MVTEDYKKTLLHFIAGDLELQEKIGGVQQEPQKAIYITVDTFLADNNINSPTFLNLFCFNYKYLLCGNYLDGSTTRGFFLVLNFDFTPLQIIKKYKDNTNIGKLYAVIQDDKNRICVIEEAEFTKFRYLNNILAKRINDTSFFAKKNRTLNFPEDIRGKTNWKIKNRIGQFIFMSKENSGEEIFAFFDVEVGEEIEWKIARTGAVHPVAENYGWKENGDVFIRVAKDTGSQIDFYDYRKKNNNFTIVGDLHFSRAEGTFLKSKYYFKNNALRFLCIKDDGNSKYNAYEYILGNAGTLPIIEQLTYFDRENSSPTNKAKIDVIQYDGYRNEYYYFFIIPTALSASGYANSKFVSVFQEGNYIQYDLGSWYSEPQLPNIVEAFKQYDLRRFIYFDSSQVRIDTFCYSENIYSGLPYTNKNSLTSMIFKLYTNNFFGNYLMLAKTVANNVLSKNTITSSCSIPNTLLNSDEYFLWQTDSEEIVGDTGIRLLQNAIMFTKNVYEEVFLNFINTIEMIVRPASGIPLNSPEDDKALVKNIFNNDYNNGKLNRVTAVFQDWSGRDFPFELTISTDDEVEVHSVIEVLDGEELIAIQLNTQSNELQYIFAEDFGGVKTAGTYDFYVKIHIE